MDPSRRERGPSRVLGPGGEGPSSPCSSVGESGPPVRDRSTVRSRSGARSNHVRVAKWHTRQLEVLVPREGCAGSTPASDTAGVAGSNPVAPTRGGVAQVVEPGILPLAPTSGRPLYGRLAEGGTRWGLWCTRAGASYSAAVSSGRRYPACTLDPGSSNPAGRGALVAAVQVRVLLPEHVQLNQPGPKEDHLAARAWLGCRPAQYARPDSSLGRALPRYGRGGRFKPDFGLGDLLSTAIVPVAY